MDALKTENQRLKDENGALIRVISKLSKWSKWNLNLIEKFLWVERAQFTCGSLKRKVSLEVCSGWFECFGAIPLKSLFSVLELGLLSRF